MATQLREDWLTQLMPDIARHFAIHQYQVPEKIRLTCGFPSKGGTAAKKRRIGEVWATECTDDGYFQISISPILDDAVKVVGVLIHEVVHTVVGIECGHKKPFSQAAKAVGLTSPWTATGESPELVETIKSWLTKFGPYPHGALKPRMQVKESEKGRMLLMECECGLKIRTTQKWIDLYGMEWPCPCRAKLIHTAKDGD